MGVGRKLKNINQSIKIIGVQPEECDLRDSVFVSHKIEAISVGVLSYFMNFSYIDEMISVNFDEIQEMRSYLAKKEGLFVGISSGANILAALKVSRMYKKGDNIITIAPDSGKSYL